MSENHVDVIIVGAGLSGIGAGCHLQKHCPGKTYIILESRQTIGGTWDLFRYPGIRSDSDMYTLGYAFRPWRGAKSIADGSSILAYIQETAETYGIDRKIRFDHRVARATWSSTEALWTLEVDHGAERVRITCSFLYTCTGYYDYADGYTPDFPGRARYTGMIVHPQQWPAHLAYAGKRVVVIGSGATAVTLVPALARTAAHVTMLQRSPSYVAALPSQDKTANWLRRNLPAHLAHGLSRWRNVLLTILFYNLARKKPAQFKQRILAMARRQLGPDYDIATHFTPTYNPWDQRMCLVPDGDLFDAIRAGTADVVTDHIDSFTETGIRLVSGAELDADIIVTATGLQLKLLGGLDLVVDGTPVDLSRTTSYKGMMYSDVPNLATALGYTNASWTLKADLTSHYVCRLINHMDSRGYTSCTPRKKRDPAMTEAPLLNFTSGYIKRAIHTFPKQGSKKPWKLYQNYILDFISLKVGTLDDGAMEFSRKGRKVHP
ncbi:NAD(P)/FAD-dependent oxidoreductase [Beijerinckia sp. L45]|uniref:flavin-containing monooxygenase n=1 Tax=Beijerinckia sp. L45 TaxID=1641855 RepID=UPI00131E14DA|nr:NAD(P)/FAD-dependent oxidoreductase [Beijerinckia sp. L45]